MLLKSDRILDTRPESVRFLLPTIIPRNNYCQFNSYIYSHNVWSVCKETFSTTKRVFCWFAVMKVFIAFKYVMPFSSSPTIHPFYECVQFVCMQVDVHWKYASVVGRIWKATCHWQIWSVLGRGVCDSPGNCCSDKQPPTDGNKAPSPLKPLEPCCWQIILTIRVHSRAWE